jgi:hypothetical protein
MFLFQAVAYLTFRKRAIFALFLCVKLAYFVFEQTRRVA